MLSLIAAAAVSLGYGISNQIPTDPIPDVDGGLEVRALWGGDHGDKWSAWLGSQPERITKEGVAYGMPVDAMPDYKYAAILRRFSIHNGYRTWFAGTGFIYRDLTTCLTGGKIARQARTNCVDGDAFVSSKWAFAQELGFRWKAIETSVGHGSTGGFSEWNHGVNFFRITFFGKIGERNGR